MKVCLYQILFFILLSLATSAALAADPPSAPVLCPVSGKVVAKKEFSAPYQGGTVYFCSAECTRSFQPEKAEHSTRANLQLVATGQAIQVACPVTGEKLDGNLTLDMQGLRIRFCCIGCLGKVNDEQQEDIRLYYVFGNNAFRNGFVVRKGK